MLYADRVALQSCIIAIIINVLQAYSSYRGNSFRIFNELFGRDSKSPLIVVVNTAREDANFKSNNNKVWYDRKQDDNPYEKNRDDNYKQNRSYEEHDANNRNDDHCNAKVNSVNALYNALIPYNRQNVLYDVLRNGIETGDKEADLQVKEAFIEYALRQRCQAKVECEEKCSKSAEEKPKEKRYCPKSCKAVYDDLIKCPPPGNRKSDKTKRTTTSTTKKDEEDGCKEKDSCE